MMSKRTPLAFKLAFFSILLVVFVAGSFSFFIRRGQVKAILESQEVSRLERVKALRQVAREAMLVNDDTDMVNYVNLLQTSLTIAYAMVLSEDGRVRVHTDPIQIGKTLTDDASRKALMARDRDDSIVQNLTLPDGREVIDISVPIMIGFNPGQYKGIARIGFDKSMIDKDIANSLRQIDREIVRAFWIAVVLGLLGGIIIAAYITIPIGILRRGAQQIGEGKLDHRIRVPTNDELKELADDFNLMAHKLGELDRMKQDFVSNVTHELRSPMTSIRGYVDLMLQGAAGSLSDNQRDYLSVIKNSAVRLGRFIDNLLDVAKIEAHKLKLTPEALEMRDIVREMEVLFKPQLDEKSIRFVSKVPAQVATAFVDKDKLAEVMINLTSNAIKFTPQNGEVAISVEEKPTYLEVGVHDTGVGIPADMVGKLFNKFEQVKSEAGHVRKHKGTGLGLTIAKGIVEAHGGKIWIKSPGPSGKGTTFYFTIPKLTEELKAKIAGA